jgi:hypothetical protein
VASCPWGEFRWGELSRNQNCDMLRVEWHCLINALGTYTGDFR